MNIGKLASIVAAASVLAMAPALADTSDPTPGEGSIQAQPGMDSIGIDIARAGSTPDSVSMFLAGLSADQRDDAFKACATVSQNLVSYDMTVRAFCRNVNGLGGDVGNTMGFAPEPRRFQPFGFLMGQRTYAPVSPSDLPQSDPFYPQ